MPRQEERSARRREESVTAAIAATATRWREQPWMLREKTNDEPKRIGRGRDRCAP